MAKLPKKDDKDKKQTSSEPSSDEKGTGDEPDDSTLKTLPGFKTKEGKSEKKKRIALENEAKAVKVTKLHKAEAKKLRLQYQRPLTDEEDIEVKERAILEIQRRMQEHPDAHALDDLHVSDVEEGQVDEDPEEEEDKISFDPEGSDPKSKGKMPLSDLNPMGEDLREFDRVGQNPFGPEQFNQLQNSVIRQNQNLSKSISFLTQTFDDMHKENLGKGDHNSRTLAALKEKLPPKLDKLDPRRAEYEANARACATLIYPGQKFTKLTKLKGIDEANHVKNFIEDIIRFDLSPWLYYDLIDTYTHNVLKQRLVMRQLTHEISEANLDYMNWPTSMWQGNQDRWAYYAGSAENFE